jgi:hypothetical protein
MFNNSMLNLHGVMASKSSAETKVNVLIVTKVPAIETAQAKKEV